MLSLLNSAPELLKTIGHLGLFAIVFVETGLFVGFFLPGDSILFAAGILASQGIFNIWLTVLGVIVSAIAGDTVGYFIGKKLGQSLYTRKESFFLRKSHIEKTRAFFDKHGGKTILLARFTPIVRTFAPVLAGAGAMNYRRFIAYNVVGGILWGSLVPLLGYFLGTRIPNIDRYVVPIILAIIVLSFVPVVVEFWKAKRNQSPEISSGPAR